MTESSIQRRARLACHRVKCVLIVANGLDSGTRGEIDADIGQIERLSNRQLEAMEEHYEQLLRNLDALLGFIATPDDMVKLAERAGAGPDPLLWMPKAYIDSALFSRFSAVFERWRQIPPHARLGIDFHGVVPQTGTTIEWRLLEAVLFEDMAMLWNDSMDARTDDSHAVGDAKVPGKRFRVLVRSCARAVFALLEGYLNGVALDILWSVEGEALDARAKEFLLERSESGAPRFMRLRDKVMQYPRIALGVQHPPIQENQPHLALILQRERDWRDAVMHPTPRSEEGRAVPREKFFHEISLVELSQVIDAAIGLIRSIDTALAGKFGSVAVWLFDRDKDGHFSTSVFH